MTRVSRVPVTLVVIPSLLIKFINRISFPKH